MISMVKVASKTPKEEGRNDYAKGSGRQSVADGTTCQRRKAIPENESRDKRKSQEEEVYNGGEGGYEGLPRG